MTIDVAEIQPITRGSDAREVALGVSGDLIALLETLDAKDWRAQTECPDWKVEDMVGHVIGMAKGFVKQREFFRQQLHGFRNAKNFDGNPLDATNELQISEHRQLDPAERLAALRAVATDAVEGRMGPHPVMRLMAFPVKSNGSVVAGMPPSLRYAHLVDTVVTRDSWMHRIDIARAVGADLPLGGTDHRVVEDVVAEWVGRHRQPVRLELTGAAGGSYVSGVGGPTLKMDAVEFCRALSGRAPGEGLLNTKVFF